MVLTAKWEANSYTVKFDSNGGVGSMSDEKFTYDEAKALTANSYSRTGYKFVGWLSEDGKTVYSDRQVASNLAESGVTTLKAKWEAVTYAITLETNGGIVNKNKISYTVENNIEIENAQYSAYSEFNKFIGWYTDSSLKQAFINDLKNNPRDITLYAKWDLYTVYKTIDSTPWSLGGKVIIDWSAESNTDMLNHTKRNVANNRYNNVDINNTATDIIFIGATNKTFKNFRMYICSFAKGQNLTIRFKNFNFITNESAAIGLYDDKGVKLTIDVIGDCSIGTSYEGGSAIGVSDSPIANLYFIGSGSLTLTAGKGADGYYTSNACVNPKKGGVALYATNTNVNISGNLLVYGGKGGRGYDGAAGSSSGENGYGGCSGAQGGVAVSGTKLTVVSGKVTLYGGAGGNGGNGGNGATGNTPEHSGGGWRDGGPGGNGGNGGDGGNGGYGSVGTDAVIIDQTSVLQNVKGETGNGGKGGNGGNGGNGDSNYGPGTSGGAGGKGGAGGVGWNGGNAKSGNNGLSGQGGKQI